MAANLENPLQQLKRVRYQCAALQGVLVQEAVLHHGDRLTMAGLTLAMEYCGPTEGVFVA